MRRPGSPGRQAGFGQERLFFRVIRTPSPCATENRGEVAARSRRTADSTGSARPWTACRRDAADGARSPLGREGPQSASTDKRDAGRNARPDHEGRGSP